MPGRVLIGGPLFWTLVGVLFLAGMLAAYVAIDVSRRAWWPGARMAERLRWWYLVPQSAYLVLMLLGQFGAMPMAVTGAVVLCTPLALAQQATYLLRIVFPKTPAAPEDDREFEILADGGDTIEPESAPRES
jgi:hypothetical protein